jgi:hypothetical protein
VLRVGARVRIARESPADELTVASDDIVGVGVDDVAAGSAAHRVPRAVVRDGHEVVPRPGVDGVAAGPALQEVRACEPEEPIAPGEASHGVGTRCPDEEVRARRAGHDASARRRRADRQGGDGDRCDDDGAHRMNRTRAVTPGLHVADYDPVS